jgi:hypothetical protein
MIPRIIHYCWFGRGPKPPLVKHCMKTWRTHLHGYKFIEWNEDNFDVNILDFSAEAYKRRKFAFVSDVARGIVLYEHGGIYLDTDVEVLRSFDPLLEHRSFWGVDPDDNIASCTIGAVKQHELVGEYLDTYRDLHFIKPDGTNDLLVNTPFITKIFLRKGFIFNKTIQSVGNNNVVYPLAWFCPYDYVSGKMNDCSQSYSIHYSTFSWHSPWVQFKHIIRRNMARVPGGIKLIALLHSFNRRK